MLPTYRIADSGFRPRGTRWWRRRRATAHPSWPKRAPGTPRRPPTRQNRHLSRHCSATIANGAPGARGASSPRCVDMIRAHARENPPTIAAVLDFCTFSRPDCRLHSHCRFTRFPGTKTRRPAQPTSQDVSRRYVAREERSSSQKRAKTSASGSNAAKKEHFTHPRARQPLPTANRSADFHQISFVGPLVAPFEPPAIRIPWKVRGTGSYCCKTSCRGPKIPKNPHAFPAISATTASISPHETATAFSYHRTTIPVVTGPEIAQARAQNPANVAPSPANPAQVYPSHGTLQHTSPSMPTISDAHGHAR